MPKEVPQPIPEPVAVTDSTVSAPQPPIPFNIGEEFGTAGKNLPHLGIVGTVVGVIAIIAAIIAFAQRPQQKATGSIVNVLSTDVAGQNMVMVGIEVAINNQGDKPFVPRQAKAELQADKGTFSDDAASAVDVPRYLQAFPVLAGDGAAPLQFGQPVRPGAQVKGILIVTFPITADDLSHRKQLRVTITDPDQVVPLVLTK